MNKLLRQYPYGFVFSEVEFDTLPASYRLIKVLNKFYYYYDTYNSLYENKDSFIIIHGHYKYISSNNGQEISNKEILKVLLDSFYKNKEEFLNLLDFIGGRYVVIIGDPDKVEVYPDACMCRSIYYTTDRNIVASHVEMIVDNFGYDKDPVAEQAPRVSFNLTKSPYVGIKSLLPNISLEVFSKSTYRFFPRYENKYNKLDEESKFVLIEKLWKGQLEHYVKNYENLVFSITAGSDSRVSLAMAKEFKNKIKFFTYAPADSNTTSDSYFIKSLSIDKSVVNQFVRDIDFNHKFLIFGDENEDLSEEEVEVLNKNTVKIHGRFLLKHYVHSFPEDSVMHIRANLLEIGRAHFLNNDRPSNIKSIKNVYDFDLKSYFKVLPKADLDLVFNEGIKEFHYNETYDYHLLDLYYWENRMGRWFSEVLNETDSAFETVLPYNMRAIIDVSLSFNLDKRRDDYMFKELVNRNFPILNFYGRNVVENTYEQDRNKKYSKCNLIEVANIYNASHERVLTFELIDNTLFLPAEFIQKGYTSETQFSFIEEKGLMNLDLISPYFSKKAENYLVYEILINDKVVLKEDMSKWAFSNKVCLMNLSKGDLIKLRVTSCRNTPQVSWRNASQLQVQSLEQVRTDHIYPVTITCTSPKSVLNNAI